MKTVDIIDLYDPIPDFDNDIELLNCYCSGLETMSQLPILPNSLLLFDCSSNNLKKLEGLPDNLEELFCAENKIESLPNLPESLKLLSIWDNPIKNISGIWNCKNLSEIRYSQPNLVKELNLYSNITGCKIEYWGN